LLGLVVTIEKLVIKIIGYINCGKVKIFKKVSYIYYITLKRNGELAQQIEN